MNALALGLAMVEAIQTPSTLLPLVRATDGGDCEVLAAPDDALERARLGLSSGVP